ncbi:MAG: hypothetical protein OXD30_00745, partial [Bryobacterales bacterium]|nr:hypothetical protein [Bryobacterales bacterium]
DTQYTCFPKGLSTHLGSYVKRPVVAGKSGSSASSTVAALALAAWCAVSALGNGVGNETTVHAAASAVAGARMPDF